MFFEGDNRKLANGGPSKGYAMWMWVLLFVLVGPALQLMHAQVASGLTGTVTDASGAAVPGALVTFFQVATGITIRATSSSVGTYTAMLSAGAYNVAVAVPGFERFEATHVVVEVGAVPTFNIKLTVGASTQTVEVTSSSAIELNTTNPQLDSIIPTAEVTDLPILINGNMRQITTFATLAPGVRSGSYGSVVVEGGASGQINAAGNYYNGLQIDTASDINSDPPYDMVDQFRVVRNAFSAKFGMVQGAVDYNMRSGTNQLHGDGFLIDRNSSFDSAGFFPTRFHPGTTVAVAPIDKETDWGATVGGPVVLPKLYNGHNKTFFLASFDVFNKNQGNTAVGTVPTPAEVGGDFSNFVDTTGTQIPIYDPTTGAQFVCNGKLNVICPNRFDPLSKSLLQYIPAPNTTGTNYGMDSNMNPVIPSVPYQTQAYGVTINHQISPSQNIAFTWWKNHYYVIQEENAPIVPDTNPLTGEQWGIDNANVWLGNYSKTIHPNLVLTVGVAAQNKMQNYQNSNNNVSFPGVIGSSIMPEITFNGQNAPTTFGNSDNAIVQYNVDNIGINGFNNWMWTKGRHTFNIGGEYHHYYEITLSNYSGGHFSFSQAETSIPNTASSNFSKYGSSFASFLLGLPDSASRTAVVDTAVNTDAIAAYIQDDVKLTSKLTLNAGLRWDLMMPYTMAENDDVFLNGSSPAPGTVNPATGNGLAGWATEYGNCAGCAGYNQIGIHGLNFGPRVGFAYGLDKNTVIQGGYTVTFLGYNGAYGQGEGLSGGPNNMASLLSGSYTVNGTCSYTYGYGEWTNPASGAVNPLPNVQPNAFSQSLGLGQTIYYLDYAHNGEAPMLQMWTLSVQRQIPWHTMLTIDYTGNHVAHLSGYNINPINQIPASVLQQYGTQLTSLSFANGTAQAAGFTVPYANFVSNFGASATLNQSLKPFPQYAGVSRAWDQSATTVFSALQIQADKHLSNNFNLLANIELPRLYDNMATVLDKANQRASWAEDTTGSFESKFAGTYELPFGQGQRWLNSGPLGRYAGGWQVAAILTYNNSQPLAITENANSAIMNGANRPNFNPNVRMWSGNYNQVTKYFEGKGPAPYLFSTGAWSPTANQYVLGNANRAYNSVRGPWYPVENLSAKKLFHITEGQSFSVRMDYFNAFNRVQNPFPTTNASATNFGQITSKFSATNRQGQIEASYNF